MLIFLLVTSLLAISVFSMNCLEDRINLFYQDKVQVFYQTENLLLDSEKKILIGYEVPPNTEIIDADMCGVTFYRITASSVYHGAKTVLQSIFVKVGDVSGCAEKPKVVTGRQSFLIVS